MFYFKDPQFYVTMLAVESEIDDVVNTGSMVVSEVMWFPVDKEVE